MQLIIANPHVSILKTPPLISSLNPHRLTGITPRVRGHEGLEAPAGSDGVAGASAPGTDGLDPRHVARARGSPPPLSEARTGPGAVGSPGRGPRGRQGRAEPVVGRGRVGLNRVQPVAPRLSPVGWRGRKRGGVGGV